MGSKSNTMSIGSFILTIVVLLGTVKTYSQNLCASLFAKPSVYGSSFPYLKELNNSSVDLIKVLKNKPQDLDSSVVDQKIAALSVLAEKYFDSNDIKFEKLGSSMTFKNLKYFEEYSTFYPLYQLTGSKSGDAISRMMYGAQFNPENKIYPLKIVFDLFYQMNYPESNGHFSAKSMSLKIGPHVILQEIAGLSTTLRHEIQHYFEQIKILNGEMTLARISCLELRPKNTDPYARFLGVDELETHLRDLRALLNLDLMNTKDKRLTGIITNKSNMENIKKQRHLLAAEKYKRILMLIEKSKSVLNNLSNVANPSAIFLNKVTGGVEVSFAFLPSPYSMVKIELLGLLGPENDIKNNQKISESVKQTIDWSYSRIEQIEAELKLLALKLNQ